MYTKKSIKAKIANMKSKLKQLYTEIDQLCLKINSSNQAKSLSNRQTPTRATKDRSSKEGSLKLNELQNKIKCQYNEYKDDAEKMIKTIEGQIGHLNADIDSLKAQLGKI